MAVQTPQWAWTLRFTTLWILSDRKFKKTIGYHGSVALVNMNIYQKIFQDYDLCVLNYYLAFDHDERHQSLNYATSSATKFFYNISYNTGTIGAIV